MIALTQPVKAAANRFLPRNSSLLLKGAVCVFTLLICIVASEPLLWTRAGCSQAGAVASIIVPATAVASNMMYPARGRRLAAATFLTLGMASLLFGIAVWCIRSVSPLHLDDLRPPPEPSPFSHTSATELSHLLPPLWEHIAELLHAPVSERDATWLFAFINATHNV